MTTAHVRRFTVAFISIALAIITTSGCGKSNPIDGTYQDSSKLTLIRLHGGKAEITFAGMTRDANYQVVGTTLKVTWPNGHQFSDFTINNDGSLTGNTGGDRWTKQ